MIARIARLFVIKTRIEAFMIIYALALGAGERGSVYLHRFPGFGGKLLFVACLGSVLMAGVKILDCLKHERALAAAAPAHTPDILHEARLPANENSPRSARCVS